MSELEIEIDDAISVFEKNLSSEFIKPSEYYNGTERDLAVGIATPPNLRVLLAQVGVPRIYVNAVSERLIIEGFRIGGSGDTDDELWAWFKANRMDTAAQSGFRDALVYGRSYITVSAPGMTEEEANDPMLVKDVPIIRVESPLSLYAEIDPKTRNVVWAVRVVKNDSGEVVSASLYFPDRTEIFDLDGGELKPSATVQHNLGVVPVVPLVHHASSSDIYGSSLITPEIRSITDAMSRSLMNMQITSELMATPQRMLFGSSVEEINGKNQSGLELYTSSYIVVEDPQASAIQLPAAELRNYTEAISHMMKMAAAYTGLPPQYLSFSSDSPASAEAIRSSESRLVRTCESVAGMFGDAWEQAMRIALLIDGRGLTLDHFRMETVWRDPATPTFHAKADASQKLYNQGRGIIPKEQARIDMGYTPEQRRQMAEWDKLDPAVSLSSLYSGEGVEIESGAVGGSGSGTGEADI